uniref:OTU domain-containing protein n=1 Tax=Chromera velia CCMP2878 TaxID=1169474 RepID=A0A0G4GN00_9ALVE|eukprot:Cvel_4946.t1-p1 / transcript=Cvel_4946.t1 / gene=Cvel_4946 / organism=Chromera_velia_CCMP2878 / gene_product=hypothetical protein / transcript_product=hypothetical protein / location=Cvel_scaffold223:97976-100714(+) / protein_length=408 / sequence_SO=supercontig / SO=protein_coding / is_pseudo=false
MWLVVGMVGSVYARGTMGGGDSLWKWKCIREGRQEPLFLRGALRWFSLKQIKWLRGVADVETGPLSPVGSSVAPFARLRSLRLFRRRHCTERLWALLRQKSLICCTQPARCDGGGGDGDGDGDRHGEETASRTEPCRFWGLGAGCGAWQRMSRAWERRRLPGGGRLFRKECGGDGDCLFRSLAAGIADAGLRWDSCDLQLSSSKIGTRSVSVGFMREMVAKGFVGLAPDQALESLLSDEGAEWSEGARAEFRERAEILAAMELSGEWLDRFSPSAILQGGRYMTSSGEIVDTSSEGGKALAFALELSTCGNVHWGTELDVGLLEDALGVGVVVLSSETGRVYNHGVKFDRKRRHFILIYYLDGIHYQLAGFQESGRSGGGEVRSVFSRKSLPQQIRALVEEDCKGTFA